MSDEDAFWRAIDAAPGDLLPVGAFADWLMERGDPRGEALAWCRDERRMPSAWRLDSGRTVFDWFDPNPPWAPPETCLPVELYDALPRDRRNTTLRGRYVSNADAYLAVCSAWVVLEATGIDPRTGDPRTGRALPSPSPAP